MAKPRKAMITMFPTWSCQCSPVRRFQFTMAECLQDLLQCSICLERFTQPKGLPCQHTFCLSCLRGIVKDDKTLACPQCRVEHQLPKGGVDGLPDNILAKNFLNMFGENVTITTSPQAGCFDCHRKASLSECQHCRESVCVNCRVSHEKLLREIQIFLKVGENDPKENLAGSDECLDNLLKEIAEKNAEMSEKFNNLRKAIEEKIDKRERALSKLLDTLEKRISDAKSGEETLSHEMKDELSECKTTLTLKTFKHLLESTEKISSALLKHPEADLQIDIDCDIEHFLETAVKVKIDEEVLTTGFASDETSSQSRRELSNIGRYIDFSNTLPTKVNYKAKEGTLKSIIEKHPDGTKALVPEFAVYSQKLESIFSISESRVLVYPLAGADGGQVLSPTVTSCTHIAASDSGKLLVAEGPAVNVFDLVKRRYLDNIGSVTTKLEIKLDKVKSVDQICCYGEEFVVLTSNEKKMLIFSEEGQFIREFTVEKINSESRMTVDQEGRIYLTGGVAITERKESGQMKGCPHHSDYHHHSQLRVTTSVQVHVYSWTGQFISNLQLVDGLTKTYDYKFDASCGFCGNNHARNNNSLPENDQILNESLKDIKGLCVDGDGFLSIAIKNQIQVYSQKPKPLSDQTSNEKPQLAVAEAAENQTGKLDLVTSIGRHMTPGGGFGGELGGVSLMPDGRMIVCEKGANRIVIL